MPTRTSGSTSPSAAADLARTRSLTMKALDVPKPADDVDGDDEVTQTGAAKADGFEGEAKPFPSFDQFKKTFPELANQRTDSLKKLYGTIQKVKDGTPSEQLAAAAELVKTYPKQAESFLNRCGVSNTITRKLLKNPDTFKALSTLVDDKASAIDKVKAGLTFGKAVGSSFKPEDLNTVLKKSLGGTAAAGKLIDAITTMNDPKKSAVDKAKATFQFLTSAKDFAGKEFPKLADELRRLDGSFKTVSSAVTLLDPNSSTRDKAFAAAQIAAEVPDLKKDLNAFTEFLANAGVKDAEKVASDSTKLVESGVKGLAPELGQKLSQSQLEALKTVSADKDIAAALPSVLERLGSPAEVEAVTKQLAGLDGKSGKALLETLGNLEKGTMQKMLSKEGTQTLETLTKIAKDLPEAAKGSMARVLSHFDEAALKHFGELGSKIDGKALGELLKVCEKTDSKLVGAALKGIAATLEKVGVKITGEVALKAFKGLGKMLPVAGAAVSGIDTVRFAMEAANSKLPPDLRMFASATAKLNGLDTALGVIEATGVGNIDAPVQIGLGVAEVAMDIAYQAEKDKWQADPANYKAPGWMKAVNIASAVASGPAGLVELGTYYGPEGAAQLIQDGVKAGAKGSIELAKFAGMSEAQAVGDSMKATGMVLHGMADVIRNPGKYGAKAQELVKKAGDAFNSVIAKGGALAEAAKKEFSSAVDTALKAGAKGLDALKWVAQNPGEVAKMAVNGINTMLTKGLDLATDAGKALYKKGVETLSSLQQGWSELKGSAKKEAAELLASAKQGIEHGMQRAVELGAKGAELISWAATHPSDVGDLARQKLTDMVKAGGETAKAAWQETLKLGAQGKEFATHLMKEAASLGAKGAETAKMMWDEAQKLPGKAKEMVGAVFNGLKAAGEKGIDTLKYIAEHPGDASLRATQYVKDTFNGMVRAGGEAAKKAAGAVKEFIDKRATWAIDTGKELLRDGVGAMKEVAKAWKTNITQGAEAVIDGLKDMGAAGVDALKDLSHAGGELAKEAMGHLFELSKAGNRLAGEALKGLAVVEGEVGALAASAYKSTKKATNGEITVFGRHVDLNPFW